MKLVIYIGPSLRPADLATLSQYATEREVTLDLRPPIARFDLLRLLEAEQAQARVLMLDGEFGQNLSVSVTEIRTYLRAGRYISGASSMGALRAVECRTIGMRGHGWVTARYLDGTVYADDEVGLLYDPETHEPVTIPLINIRWLAHELEADGTLDAASARAVFAFAAAVHYRTRTADSLLRAARQLPYGVADVLAARLSEDQIQVWDRKRLDALEAARTEIDELAAARLSSRTCGAPDLRRDAPQHDRVLDLTVAAGHGHLHRTPAHPFAWEWHVPTEKVVTGGRGDQQQGTRAPGRAGFDTRALPGALPARKITANTAAPPRKTSGHKPVPQTPMLSSWPQYGSRAAGNTPGY